MLYYNYNKERRVISGMINLVYSWNSDSFCFDLFSVENGEKHLVGEFADREDLLIYIEKKYYMANLIIIKEND